MQKSAPESNTCTFLTLSGWPFIIKRHREVWMDAYGGLTFHECNVDILALFQSLEKRRCAQSYFFDFIMLGCFFDDVSSDAGWRFRSRTDQNCRFERIGGDAIDVSGSDISVEEVRAQSVFDKALSAGEGSSVVISNSSFQQVSYALHQDLSIVKASKIKVRNAKNQSSPHTRKRSLRTCQNRDQRTGYGRNQQKAFGSGR